MVDLEQTQPRHPPLFGVGGVDSMADLKRVMRSNGWRPKKGEQRDILSSLTATTHGLYRPASLMISDQAASQLNRLHDQITWTTL